METRELTFEQEKETKNTVRYQEQPEDGNDPVIGPLYVQKSALGEDPPKVLSVTVGVPVPAEELDNTDEQFEESDWAEDDEELSDEEPSDEEPSDEELETVEA